MVYIQYIPFEETCKYLKDNNITSVKLWTNFKKKINNILPKNIPKIVEYIYIKKNKRMEKVGLILKIYKITKNTK